MHFSNISTAHALRQIAKAKKLGLNVTCDVAAHNLIFDDALLSDFDTNYKVNPPLRNKRDINALEKGIFSGDIDVIVSSHSPQDQESKKLEFDHAEFGMIGLQTFFPIVMRKLNRMDISILLEKFTINPRKILNLPLPVFEEDEKADLTIFDPEMEWSYTMDTNYSKSSNSPLLGQKLKGGVIGVVNNGKSFFNTFS